MRTEKIWKKMAPERFSGKEKAIIVFCCILLVAAGFLLVTGFAQQADQKKYSIQLHLKSVANRMAQQMNGDGLLSIQPGEEGKPRYLSFANALYEGRKNDSFIVTSYLLRIDNGTIRYVVHDAYVTHGPDDYFVPTGELVTEDTEVILNASVNGSIYSPRAYTSKWGSYISGYAPVRDSNGTVVGVLGVDETEETVFSYTTYQFYNLIEAV